MQTRQQVSLASTQLSKEARMGRIVGLCPKAAAPKNEIKQEAVKEAAPAVSSEVKKAEPKKAKGTK